MGNNSGVAVTTGRSPKSRRNKRTGAGKEAAKAAKKSSTMESEGVTGGGGTTEATGVTGGGGATEGATGVSQTGMPDVTGAATQAGDNNKTAAAAPAPVQAEKKKPVFHHCGLDDDSDEWTEDEGPQRITTSQLTAEERAKFQRHLDQIFSYDTAILSVRYIFDPEDVEEVMEKVLPYLKSEPVLIEDVPFPINIVGDIHGQLYDLNRIFNIEAKDGKKGWECKKFIFMGDYVDRGKQSLEVIMALFCIKMLYPDDIFLLRGNHEFLNVNFNYGFYDDLKARYEKDSALYLYLLINSTFAYLSVGAILGGKYFCAHGGISLQGFTRDAMRSFSKPIIKSDDDYLIHDLVWSDPAIGLKGSVFNALRGSSFYFGLPDLAHALESMEVKAIFRGHTVLDTGYAVNWHCLITVFSATDIRGNKGAVARLDENGKLSFVVLEVSHRRHLWNREIKRLAGEPLDDEEDAKTEHDLGTGSIVKIGGGH